MTLEAQQREVVATMMKQMATIRWRWRLTVIAVLLTWSQVQAWTLFPTADDRAASLLKRADRVLTQADSTYEGGNPDQARQLYERALQQYERLQQQAPQLHDGLPQYRIDYCRGQLDAIALLLVDNSNPEAVREAEAARKGQISQMGASDELQRPRRRLDTASLEVGATTPARLPLRSVADGSADPEHHLAEPPERPVVDPELVAAELEEARLLLADEKLGDAARLLVDVLRNDPQNRTARLLLAQTRTRQGRYDEALAALEDLSGIRDDLPLLLTMAAANCGAQRYFDAMLMLDQAITIAPRHPHAYVNLAWLHLIQGRGATAKRDAEAYYRQAVKLGARRDRALEVRLELE